jgi:GTP-binding protein YchF
MRAGLIGFACSGRTTLYRAAAGGEAKGDVTAVPVPDPRFDRIVAQVKPKKATPATVILHDDIEGAHGAGQRMLGQRFLDAARKMEILLHVVRAFDSPSASYHESVDPLRDQTRLEEELILADLQVIENRLERLGKTPDSRQPGHAEYLERVLFSRVKPELESGRPLRTVAMDEDEEAICRTFQLLTAKPMIVAFNVGEADAASPPKAIQRRIAALEANGAPAFAVSAELEMEMAQLSPSDRAEFLSSYGLTEPASHKVVRAAYAGMDLITFFTTNDNEARAWPLRRASTALKAAATVHTGIAKGFIRAEVTHYADYEAHGSVQAAHAAHKMRLEGKEYVVRDGDILQIRHKT